MDLSAVQQVTLQDTNALATTFSIDGTTCSGVATVKQTTTTTFQFTAVALGTCAVTASDNLNHSTAIQVSVQTTSVGIH
jgi:spore maturation protein SpmB